MAAWQEGGEAGEYDRVLPALGGGQRAVGQSGPDLRPVVEAEQAAGQVVRLGETTIEREADGSGPAPNGATVVSLETEVRTTSIDLGAAAVADELPAVPVQEGGTLTILFSDIENSTSRSADLGDAAWMEVLNVHNAIIRRQVARFSGTEVKSEGDGFMLAFASARAAVDAMIETQRALESWARSQPTSAVRVRVGIHTGEVMRIQDDFHGRHVNIAARVANSARGGEILVSALVWEIIDARGDLTFDESRTVPLKGLPGDLDPAPGALATRHLTDSDRHRSPCVTRAMARYTHAERGER